MDAENGRQLSAKAAAVPFDGRDDGALEVEDLKPQFLGLEDFMPHGEGRDVDPPLDIP